MPLASIRYLLGDMILSPKLSGCYARDSASFFESPHPPPLSADTDLEEMIYKWKHVNRGTVCKYTAIALVFWKLFMLFLLGDFV